VTAAEPPVVPTGAAGPAGPLSGPAGPLSGQPAAGSGPQPTAPARSRGRAVGRSLAAGLLIFVIVVLVLFVVFNTQTVDISLVFGNVEAPLVLALVIGAALGGLVVGLAGVALRARRNRRS
jgi:uncharacterized integral membrane protein